ncbi:hypothetical protein [Sulfuricurvum sp.]|uniref:hypothetical protein n=1 Tax=Sulfuricurvum sp. TaxID=2025608 RepID=UPI0026167414|nr:hypothetical protein [Sulfuricurvum sp.]MDD2267471.1 hypothetical protein [Sulfuricurvum sp.]MDD2782808.1 hypothetical protein [Sulfuricurvum sp.]
MPERDAYLKSINDIIEAERGSTLHEDQLLIESGMDSFSYAVFWLSLSDMGMNLNDEWIDTLDYETLTVSIIIDKIMEQCDGTH